MAKFIGIELIEDRGGVLGTGYARGLQRRLAQLALPPLDLSYRVLHRGREVLRSDLGNVDRPVQFVAPPLGIIQTRLSRRECARAPLVRDLGAAEVGEHRSSHV